MKRTLTLGGIKPSNLDNVVALRPAKLGHLFLGAKISEFPHVVLGIPNVNVEVRMKAETQ